MSWWLWGIAANVGIMATEYFNRTSTTTFLATLAVTFPFIALAQYGLFRSWNGAPSMLLAWALFTVGNTLFRLVSVQWAVGEPPSAQTLAGVGVMVVGAFLIRGSS